MVGVSALVAVSFSVFKNKVKNSVKLQTIRLFSEKRYELIERKGLLQLYWKQRSKECELLGQGAVTELFKICFELNNVLEWDGELWVPMSFKSLDDLAVRDGFNNFFEMFMKLSELHGDLEGKEFMVIRWEKYYSPEEKAKIKSVRELAASFGMASKAVQEEWKIEMEDW